MIGSSISEQIVYRNPLVVTVSKVDWVLPKVLAAFQALVSAADSANCALESVIDEIEEIGGLTTGLGRWPETRAVEEQTAWRRASRDHHGDEQSR